MAASVVVIYGRNVIAMRKFSYSTLAKLVRECGTFRVLLSELVVFRDKANKVEVVRLVVSCLVTNIDKDSTSEHRCPYIS